MNKLKRTKSEITSGFFKSVILLQNSIYYKINKKQNTTGFVDITYRDNAVTALPTLARCQYNYVYKFADR